MVPLSSLWLPILISAVFVFVLSSIVHMVLPYHRGDYAKVPNEDAMQEALRGLSIPPGDYMLPCPSGREGMKDPAYQERLKKGPVLLVTVMPAGGFSLGPSLAMWFVYCLVVGVFAAYVAGRALGHDAHYLGVFRFAGVTAFVGYSLAAWQTTIWYKRKWTTTLKVTFDGLLYGLVTAGTFGWLWPR